MVVADPVSLGLLEAPGRLGADIVVGEAQALGNAMNFGGPGVGYLAVTTKLMRRIPGRLVGETVDLEGRRGYVLTLQTREQHIRREKATSNICSNHALNALATLVYLSWLGKEGLPELGLHCARKAAYLRERLLALPGVAAFTDGPVFREFAVRLPLPAAAAVDALVPEGFLAGVPAGRFAGQFAGLRARRRPAGRRHREAHARRARRLRRRPRPGPRRVGRWTVADRTRPRLPPGGDRPRDDLREVAAPAAARSRCPSRACPRSPRRSSSPRRCAARAPARLPELSEIDLLRHFTGLSTLNYGVDSGSYPLGSCTMKYNPRVNEAAARLDGFAGLHPYQPEALVQGALELMHELERWLAEIAGLHATTLQPAAGAHGELTGLLVIRAAHLAEGRDPKRIIIPDTAHGTNPASVIMGGFEPAPVRSDARGGVDMDALREVIAGGDIAGLMLTNPNTLGLFDENIVEIARLVHEAGGLLYYDGANANAVLGVSRPGDMGFDIVHFNTHKTFSTPHGGGGPGAGPIVVRDSLAPFLPVPLVAKGEDGRFFFEYDRPQSH